MESKSCPDGLASFDEGKSSTFSKTTKQYNFTLDNNAMVEGFASEDKFCIFSDEPESCIENGLKFLATYKSNNATDY